MTNLIDEITEAQIPVEMTEESYHTYMLLFSRLQVELRDNQAKLAAFRERHNGDLDEIKKLQNILKKQIY